MYQEFDIIRKKITNRLLIISVIFLTPAFLSALARWFEIGWTNIYVIHSALYVFLLLVLIFRKKLSTDHKVYSLGFIYTVLGWAALWYWGVSGIHYFVIIAFAMAAILTERKMAFFSIALISIGYITIGVLYMTNNRQADVDLNVFSHSIMHWASIIISLILFATIFTEGFGEMYKHLVSALEEGSRAKDKIEEQNSKLRKTKNELTQKVEEIHKVNLKLQLSEEKYRDLVNFSPSVIYWYSTKNGPLFFSERITDILGYTPAELENNFGLWQSLIHEEDLGQYHENFKSLKPNITASHEYRMTTKAGESIWVKDTYVAIRITGDETIVEGFLSDISEEKRMEKKLRESERRWQFSVDGSDLGLWDWNIKRNDVFFSPQWKKMLQYEEHEIENKIEEWEKRVHPDDMPEVMKSIQKCLNGETANYESEHRLLCKNGQYKWILDRGKVIAYNDDNTPRRMIGTHADIDQKKRYELELKQSNATKDRLFSIIAHDLRSPFNSMIGFSEILHNNYDDLDEKTKRKFIATINDETIKTFNLLEDLLLWSRTQRDSIDFFPTNVDLMKLLEDIVSTFKVAAITKEIKLIVEVEQDTKVYSDKFMLSSVLRNLISNAIKFSSRKGEVKIAERKVEKEEKMYSEICVCDTGVGISEADQEHIFDISKNKSTIGTEDEKGSGMGLPICYEFIQKHGGEIWVESTPGKGTCFFFILPYNNS